jgi:hypothetical protein
MKKFYFFLFVIAVFFTAVGVQATTKRQEQSFLAAPRANKYYCIAVKEGQAGTAGGNCFSFFRGNLTIGNLCIVPTADDYVTEDLIVAFDEDWVLHDVSIWRGFNILKSPLDRDGLPRRDLYKEKCPLPERYDTSSCTVPIAIIQMFEGEALAESRNFICNRSIYLAVYVSASNRVTGEEIEVWSSGRPFSRLNPTITYSALEIRCDDPSCQSSPNTF